MPSEVAIYEIGQSPTSVGNVNSQHSSLIF